MYISLWKCWSYSFIVLIDKQMYSMYSGWRVDRSERGYLLQSALRYARTFIWYEASVDLSLDLVRGAIFIYWFKYFMSRRIKQKNMTWLATQHYFAMILSSHSRGFSVPLRHELQVHPWMPWQFTSLSAFVLNQWAITPFIPRAIVHLMCSNPNIHSRIKMIFFILFCFSLVFVLPLKKRVSNLRQLRVHV